MIDLNEVSLETPLPVTTEALWASSTNKTKVQELLRSFIMDNPVASMDTLVSAIGWCSYLMIQMLWSLYFTTRIYSNVMV